MARRIEEVMTRGVKSVMRDTSVRDVAQLMRDHQIGDVLVTQEDGTLCGIVTDRDVVVRAVASGQDPDKTTVGDICTAQIVTLEPGASVEDAVSMMRDKAIRRVPVVENDKPVGIVSIGDLAVENDPRSALAQISAASPTH